MTIEIVGVMATFGVTALLLVLRHLLVSAGKSARNVSVRMRSQDERNGPGAERGQVRQIYPVEGKRGTLKAGASSQPR